MRLGNAERIGDMPDESRLGSASDGSATAAAHPLLSHVRQTRPGNLGLLHFTIRMVEECGESIQAVGKGCTVLDNRGQIESK